MSHERFDSEPSVAATANRLRLVRLDFAGEDPQVREEYLAEELTRALAAVPPGDRAAFLEQLTAHFPSWDSQVDVATRSRETVPRSGVDERELADWSFLVTRLIAVWPSLSEGERQAARDRLVAEGLVDAAPAIVWRDDTAKALQQVLGLPQDTPMDPIRALGVIDLLVRIVMRLDKLAWKTWRDIAPKEKLRDPSKLKATLARLISGDEDVSRGQIEKDLEELRGIVAAMVFGIKNAPREWANRHLEEFSPAAIESVVDIEGVKKFIESKDVKCWHKYKQLAEELDPARMSLDILQVVGEFASRVLDSGRV